MSTPTTTPAINPALRTNDTVLYGLLLCSRCEKQSLPLAHGESENRAHVAQSTCRCCQQCN